MKSIKVETWLPVFSGFYGTIWESDNSEESEMDWINEQRKEKGLPPVDWDAIDWDYDGYAKQVSEEVTHYVGDALKVLGMIAGYSYQKLNSPREYNFANDSIDVAFSLNVKNKKAIAAYLKENATAFDGYLKDHYTSYDGFISSHSNNPDVWTVDLEDTLMHAHRLGAVLNFILLNENGNEFEMEIYEHVTGNIDGIHATNYAKLLEVA